MRRFVEARLKQFKKHGLHIGHLSKLLRMGEEFTTIRDYEPINEWAKKAKPKLKQCFQNCQQAVIDRVPRVKYAEGFILVAGLLIHHAWLVVGKRVVEITRTDKNLAKAFKKQGKVYTPSEDPVRYFGITFPRKRIVDHLYEQDFYCGLLDL